MVFSFVRSFYFAFFVCSIVYSLLLFVDGLFSVVVECWMVTNLP